MGSTPPLFVPPSSRAVMRSTCLGFRLQEFISHNVLIKWLDLVKVNTKLTILCGGVTF